VAEILEMVFGAFAMTKGESATSRASFFLSFFLCLGLILSAVLFGIWATARDAKQHLTITLDDRYWYCTKSETIPIGMARGQECVQWTRK
jgi:hypothetical protein